LVDFLAQTLDIGPQPRVERLELGQIALALRKLPVLYAIEIVARVHAHFL
jgi:hypothetical protein